MSDPQSTTDPIDQISPTDQPTDQPAVDPAVQTDPPAREIELKDPLRGSKASGFNAAVIGLGVVLVLVIIFIVQNTHRTKVSFLWLSGTPSLAVALLVATAAGIFLAGLASLLRIMQLRRRVKHERKARKKA